jgi:hypothetical protein
VEGETVNINVPREHAQRLYVILDRMQVVGLEAKQMVVETMQAIKEAGGAPSGALGGLPSAIEK